MHPRARDARPLAICTLGALRGGVVARGRGRSVAEPPEGRESAERGHERAAIP